MRSVHQCLPRQQPPAPSSHQHQQPTGSVYGAAGTYSRAAQRGTMPVRPSQDPVPQTVPFPHLEHRRVVGQGSGSALEAALQGGRATDRLIARLEPDAAARQKDPVDLVRLINTSLETAGAAPGIQVDVASQCPTGVTMMPKKTCTVTQLATYKEVIAGALQAITIDDNEQWIRLVLHGCPTHAGSGPIDEDYLGERLDEALPFGARRGTVRRLCAKDQDWTIKETTPVAFYVSASSNVSEKTTIRMLGRIFRLCNFRPRPDSFMCGNCGTYRHKTTECQSQPRSRRCGRYGHSDAEHEQHCEACKSGVACVPRCIHCHGPHSAGDKSCKNRPTWDRFARAHTVAGGPELNKINARGDKQRNRTIRAQQGPATGANAVPTGTQGSASLA
ncbi:hypothetical protein V8E36_001893 [Tilletia maclaganii]